jgi:hypothetical protein
MGVVHIQLQACVHHWSMFGEEGPFSVALEKQHCQVLKKQLFCITFHVCEETVFSLISCFGGDNLLKSTRVTNIFRKTAERPVYMNVQAMPVAPISCPNTRPNYRFINY